MEIHEKGKVNYSDLQCMTGMRSSHTERLGTTRSHLLRFAQRQDTPSVAGEDGVRRGRCTGNWTETVAWSLDGDAEQMRLEQGGLLEVDAGGDGGQHGGDGQMQGGLFLGGRCWLPDEQGGRPHRRREPGTGSVHSFSS
ncbi:hypothetical protein SESBI_14618 [Sesbania bispinosa]|nr:hypothetical protein SESBI_14618 [Sesbania bispinosa]